jgi:hypothetical protein
LSLSRLNSRKYSNFVPEAAGKGLMSFRRLIFNRMPAANTLKQQAHFFAIERNFAKKILIY